MTNQSPSQQPVPGGQGGPAVTGSKPRFWQRTPVLIVSALVLLALGYGIGQPSAATTQKQLDTARSQLQAARTQLTVAGNNLTSERSKVQQAQAAASNANATAAAKYKADEAKLAAKEKALARTRHGLLALEGRIQASSISSDGVYVVGSDIKPGTWHTKGDGGSGDQCYYATLGSTNISDILDNNNFDGPETVDVTGAHAFQISGPCTWVRVG
jgi:hypothetical protein